MFKKVNNSESLGFFGISLKVFEFFGFRKDEEKKWRKFGIFVKQFLIIFSVSLLVFFFLSEGYSEYVDGNMDASLSGVFFGCAILTDLYKTIVVKVDRDKLVECIESLENCAKVFKNQTKIQNCTKLYRLLFVFGTALTGIPLVLFGLGFVIMPVFKDVRDSSQGILLASPKFLNSLVSPYIELMFAFQFTLCSAILLFVISFDMMYCGIMNLCAALVESARDVLRQSTQSSVIDESLGRTQELKLIIKQYKTILNCISSAERIFSVPTLVHFSYSYATLALCLYQVSVLPLSSSRGLTMICGYAVLIYQLSIYCYFGQKIPTQVAEFRKDLYATDWYQQEKSYKQIVLFTLQNTEVEPYMTAGRLLPLSHSTFANILKASYTFYTFLQNFKHS